MLEVFQNMLCTISLGAIPLTQAMDALIFRRSWALGKVCGHASLMVETSIREMPPLLRAFFDLESTKTASGPQCRERCSQVLRAYTGHSVWCVPTSVKRAEKVILGGVLARVWFLYKKPFRTGMTTCE